MHSSLPQQTPEQIITEAVRTLDIFIAEQRHRAEQDGELLNYLIPNNSEWADHSTEILRKLRELLRSRFGNLHIKVDFEESPRDWHSFKIWDERKTTWSPFGIGFP